MYSGSIVTQLRAGLRLPWWFVASASTLCHDERIGSSRHTRKYLIYAIDSLHCKAHALTLMLPVVV